MTEKRQKTGASGSDKYAPHPRHPCPRCGAPAPHLHPAVQFEGEVQICTDPYHLIPTNQNRLSQSYDT